MLQNWKIIEVQIDQLELDLTNPRHDPYSKPSEAIEYLVMKERVVELALNIAQMESTNPMDLIGVVKSPKKGKVQKYKTAEGNRRICALLLLHDPERIPKGVPNRPNLVAKLDEVSRSAGVPTKINVVLFSSMKAAEPWVHMMHLNDGRSRRAWTPDQQNRAQGGGRYDSAATILDLAVLHGLISKSERERKLTTVDRYAVSPPVRRALGLIKNKEHGFVVNRPLSDFAVLMNAFIQDITDGKLSSRSDLEARVSYATDLVDRTGIVDSREDKPYPIADAFASMVADDDEDDRDDDGAGDDSDDNNDKGNDPKPRPKPLRRRTLVGDQEISELLIELNNLKVSSLWESITTLTLSRHCPLVTVGLWSFMETLAMVESDGNMTFEKSFTQDRLNKIFDIEEKQTRKDMGASLLWLTTIGNATKHSPMVGSFNPDQLGSYFDTLKPLIQAVLEKVTGRART